MNIEERKKQLTPEENHVLFNGGTEAPFTGAHLNEHRTGQFLCKVCGTPLFASDAKFESGSGWPSFDQALPGATEQVEDTSLGILRTEIRCATCHAHLGHLFDDGPATTGKRYCMNSICMDFREEDAKQP
jgi:peptide-methionine (R)-S-oxide reductase